MADIIQLRICAGADTWLIPVSQNAKLDELFNIITRKYVTDAKPFKIRLLCGDENLECRNDRCFRDHNLAHLSTVVAFLSMCGGGRPMPVEAINEKSRNLAPLPGFITVTSSPTEPDMISFDNDPDEKRARMPCGHIIGPASMTDYCQSVLSQGKFKFYCPSVDEDGKGNCNREWDYFLVRHVACLSPDEMKEFEKMISDNYLKKAKGMQTCPGCKTWCFKGDTGNYARCQLCKKDFCWACMGNWIGPSNRQSCGNFNCDGRDCKTQILAECLTKRIGGCQACPTLRACPKCGMLTEHKDACAHVTCPTCDYRFCFICLKGKTIIGECSPAGTCALAPRQTSISSEAVSWRCSVM